MISNLEALTALEAEGTMTRAAVRLRITQSAVSKRIAALEAELGQKFIEPAGRRVRLTPTGLRLLEKTRPFMAAIKEALLDDSPPEGGRIVIGISESILSSWGAEAIAQIKSEIPRLEILLNAHRSPVALDHVRSGEYMLALCAGISDDIPEFKAEPLFEEPMVIVPAGLQPIDLTAQSPLSVLTIEPHSATWHHLDKRLRAFSKTWGFSIHVEQTLQSFTCIAQIARCGLAHGLVPIGVTQSLGIPSPCLVRFPDPGLSRPISLVGRNTTFANPQVKTFHRVLSQYLSTHPVS